MESKQVYDKYIVFKNKMGAFDPCVDPGSSWDFVCSVEFKNSTQSMGSIWMDGTISPVDRHVFIIITHLDDISYKKQVNVIEITAV